MVRTTNVARIDSQVARKGIVAKRSTPESQVVRAVMDYLSAKGIFAFRLNTAGIKAGSRFFRCHSLGKGAADILAFASAGPGEWYIPCWIECKAEKGKQSPDQKDFQRKVSFMQHEYLVVRSIDDLKGIL